MSSASAPAGSRQHVDQGGERDPAGADIVVFDPEKKLTITAENQHSKTDYNLYEGTEVTGSPEVVLLRGNVLVEGDELVAAPGIGEYVARARFGQERKAKTAVA